MRTILVLVVMTLLYSSPAHSDQVALEELILNTRDDILDAVRAARTGITSARASLEAVEEKVDGIGCPNLTCAPCPELPCPSLACADPCPLCPVVEDATVCPNLEVVKKKCKVLADGRVKCRTVTIQEGK